MSPRAPVSLVFLASLALPLAGCFTHYSDGPEFRPVAHTPAGYGLVYVYRPPRGVGAGWRYPVVWQSRHFELVSGSYGVFAVPEGKQTFTGGPLLFGAPTPGANGDFTVDVQHDTPVFVRISFGSRDDPQKTEIVAAKEGLSDIASLHLGAGGGARTPVPPAPAKPPPPR